MLYPQQEWEIEELMKEKEEEEKVWRMKVMKLDLACVECGGDRVFREGKYATCHSCGCTWKVGEKKEEKVKETIAQRTLREGWRPSDEEMCCGTPVRKGRCRVCGTKVD